MKRLMNFLRGVVELTVTGLFPERLLNLCAQNGVEFWGVEWLEGGVLRLTTRRRTLKRLLELAPGRGAGTGVGQPGGFPTFCCASAPGMPSWLGWRWPCAQWPFCPGLSSPLR